MNVPHARSSGIVLVLAAVACFAALDAATKWVSLGAPALMTVWFRYLLQALLTGGLLLPSRGRALLRTRQPVLQLVRACLLLTSSSLAFLSLRHISVGEYTAVTMVTPLVVMLIASWSLGEFVPRSRWLFLCGGFAGALLVVAPGGASVDRAMLLPLLVVAVNASYQILTSRMARVDAPATIQFYTGAIGAGLASLALPWSWADLAGATWAVLALMGVFSTLGHLLLTMAYTRAPVSLLTPYLYFQIAFGAFGGWWVFGHVPSGVAGLGIAMIALFGALMSWRPSPSLIARDAPRRTSSSAGPSPAPSSAHPRA